MSGLSVAADTVLALLQAEGQALLEELLDPSERGNRGEGWVVAQLVAVAFLLFPPAVLRTLVNDSGAALMVVGVVTLCALLCTFSAHFRAGESCRLPCSGHQCCSC